MGLTRRQFLSAGAGVGALGVVGVGGLAATGRLYDARVYAERLAFGCGPKPKAPDIEIGKVETGSFRSRFMKDTDVEFAIAYPPGVKPGTPLPLVLALYGRQGDYLNPLAVTTVALPYYQASVIAAGAPPFAIATVESGPTSYWHKRADGTDPQSMIVSEYLPLLGRRKLNVDRFALHGESMGGYGVLLLGQRLGSARVAAIVCDGPALFRRYAGASPVAFDSAADFAEHDVFAGAAKLDGIPIRIACGTLDPFYRSVKAFVALPHDPPIEATYSRACHHVGYWRSETTAQLTFLATRLRQNPT